jgi:hypothetical protein
MNLGTLLYWNMLRPTTSLKLASFLLLSAEAWAQISGPRTPPHGNPVIENWACTFPSYISNSSPAIVTCPAEHGFERQAMLVWSFNGTPLDGGRITVDGVTYTLVATLDNTVSNQVLIGTPDGLGPVPGRTVMNLGHAVNDDGVGKGTLYSSATTAHPTVSASWVGNPIYNNLFWWYRHAGAQGIGRAASSSKTANGSFDTPTMRMQWNVVIKGATGTWAKLGTYALPGSYVARYIDPKRYALYTTGGTPVDTRSFGSYSGQSLLALRGDTGGGNPYPVAYTGESWSLTSRITTDPYFQVNVPGCSNRAHELECALAYRIPEAPKYPGNFQTISSFVVASGVATITLNSAFPFTAGSSWIVKPGTLIQLRNIQDSPGTWTHTSSYTNSPDNPTVTGHLVKFSPAGSDTVGALQVTDPGGAIGVCQSGCGNSGTAVIADAGLMTCTFDNATTAGHWVTVNALDDRCHDSGVAFPGAPQPLGVVQDAGPAGAHQVWWNGLNRPYTVQTVNGPGDGTKVTVLTINVPGYPDGTYPSQTLASYGGPSKSAFVDSHLTVSPYITALTIGGGGLYFYPNSTTRVQAKQQDGFDPMATNRFDFWVKWGANQKFCAASGNVVVGTYTTKPGFAGTVAHFYHTVNESVYSGQWTHYMWTNTPTHWQGISEPLTYNYPANPTITGTPYGWHEQDPYFDALATFYYDLHGLSCGSDVSGQSILLTPTAYSAVTNEPDELVLSRTAAWSPSRFQPGDGPTTPTGTQGYDLNWTGPRGYAVEYEVRYSTKRSLKVLGFSNGLCQNGTTTCGAADRIKSTSANPYVNYQSASMPQASDIWWGIRPTSVPVIAATGSGQNPVWIVTPVDMKVAAGDLVTVTGMTGNTAANQANVATTATMGWQTWQRTDPGPMPLGVGWPANSGGPVKVSLANHGFSTGNTVTISSATPSAANGVYTITVLDSNSFTLDGTSYDSVCTSACVGGSLRLSTPGPLMNIVADGAGGCTANLTVNHNIFPGWLIYVYGSTNNALTPGANAGSNNPGIKTYTVTSAPTAQSFGFACPGVAAGTYDRDFGSTIYFGVQAFPAVAIAATGNGSYVSGGQIFPTDDQRNFAEIEVPQAPPSSVAAPAATVAQSVGRTGPASDRAR